MCLPDKPQVGPLTQCTPGPVSQEEASPSRREVVTSLPFEERSSESMAGIVEKSMNLGFSFFVCVWQNFMILFTQVHCAHNLSIHFAAQPGIGIGD